MDATLILIDGDAELARALVDRLWGSDEPADIARLQAQARLIAAYEESKWPRRPYFSRSAPSNPEEGAGPAHEQASRRLMRGNDVEEPAEGHQRALDVA